ncbi:membrane-associated tyrosine- and threonine-specific cdc2-inhibitory kinase-like [Haliotis rufescens]|uniref:membrane-associated tyrosine- and threonine-specific cdc2-inhibitory kinase-like n=1 Tax=Haliotis rufescens TaxID=6454 RepID=UPI00201E88C9|nr:membrane-associated tyrosine- and threonine-specific cdc2-inhibitory kinase-like [Haliotis rufescens]
MGAEQSYIEHGKLGEGQFGVVYQVTIDGQLYALKKLKKTPNLYQTDIMREIRTLQMCSDHDNIVKLFDVQMSHDEVNILMEYCDLGTLNDYMIENRLGEETICNFMLDMARGIQGLHDKEIVHRDIKPDNILLVARFLRDPICKIADLGLARFTFPTSGDMATMSSTYYLNTGGGIPLFMAPEVYSGHYTKACDIFSLGMVFYAMHSLQTFNFSTHTLLCPVIPYSSEVFHQASQEQIKRAVTTHVSTRQNAGLLKSMLALNPHVRPGADDVESTISSYKATRDSCSLA